MFIMKIFGHFTQFVSTVTDVEVTTAPSVFANTNVVELTSNQYEEDGPLGLSEEMMLMMCSLPRAPLVSIMI